jgi:hypothetical protein
MDEETLFLFGCAGVGTALGLFSRWGPLSGWAALALSIVLAPLGLLLCVMFC